jgi:membrane-bound lytic murein transglycosylase D
VVGAVVLVSVLVISFFAIRYFQYQAVINNAKSLQQQIDNYEKKIADAKANPEGNRETLKSLINELDGKTEQLSTMKSKLDQDDFGAIYSSPLEKTITDIVGRYGENDYHIPKEMTARVQHYLDLYSGNMRGVIANYLVRKEKYFPMIVRIFREKKLPIELAYVAMNESGFNPKALSSAGARGLWQFMPKTARSFGMRVEDEVDDRLDPEKSTYAAVEYFKDLIGIFGGKSSVMLVMAAYNAGEGRLIGALRKIDDPMRNRDFWYIYHMGYLAEETNEYIPRVIAMMIIAENPQKYGFQPSQYKVPETELEQEKDFIDLGNLKAGE